MSDINFQISLGVGSPAAIPEFLTFGLQIAEVVVAEGALEGAVSIYPLLSGAVAIDPLLSGAIAIDPLLAGKIEVNP